MACLTVKRQTLHGHQFQNQNIVSRSNGDQSSDKSDKHEEQKHQTTPAPPVKPAKMIKASCQYSDNLRDLFYKINPYSLTCLYKTPFEEKAVKTLVECTDEDDYLIYHDDHFLTNTNCGQKTGDPPNDYVGATIDSEHAGEKGCEIPKNEMVDATDKKPRSSKALKLVVDLYKLLKMPSNKESDSELQCWTTCDIPHQEVSSDVINMVKSEHQAKVLRHRRHRRSSDTWKYFNKITDQHKGGAETNRPKSSETRTKHAHPPRQMPGRPSSEQSKNSTQYKNDRPSITKQGHSRGTPFKFTHHRRSDMHIDQYRNTVTKTKIKQDLAHIPAPHLTPCVTKARVKCVDVRSGACIEPSTKVAKVTVIPEKFNEKKQNQYPRQRHREQQNQTIFLSKGQSVLIRDSPRSLSVDCKGQSAIYEAPCKQGDHNTIKADQSKQTITKQQRKPRVSPIVCRSRPSIPSNSRGRIFDTAVDMPKYIVSYLKAKAPEIQQTNRSWSSITNRPSTARETTLTNLECKTQ
ncbi:unnamed protein product [Owenia fusiformis]|uniref:Uncharacterized protein n=1 Tax=Owenia fusiformis TaxID=6347 RepID=A0A8J1U2Z7_OWEFU|nr:unnamed protein product [Owenia fusiformis]